MSSRSRRPRGAGRPLSGRPVLMSPGVLAVVVALLMWLTLGAGAAGAAGSATPPAPAAAGAQNTSSVVQVIWQVQEGCLRYCTGTTQSQTAVQVAVVSQTASATASGAGASSVAVAGNQSATVQVVWQVQLGCLAFCYGTSQVQSATQSAQTDQIATAVAQAVAVAANSSNTVQIAWQLQLGCTLECHGVTAQQSTAPQQTTTQSATTTTAATQAVAGSPPWSAVRALVAQMWTLSRQLASSTQMQVQLQRAACLSHCAGGAQVQVAIQSATVTQQASATSDSAPQHVPVAIHTERRWPRAPRWQKSHHVRRHVAGLP